MTSSPILKTHEAEPHSLIGMLGSAFVTDAAKLMAERDIGALGVYATDGKDLIGIFTERDLTRCVAQGDDPSTTHISSAMSSHPVGVVGHITRSEADKVMKEAHVRHLIVHDEGRDLILSIRDV